MNASLTVEQASQEFLNWVSEYRKPKTHKWYREHLAHFLPHVAGFVVADLRAFHLRDFLSVQPWSQSYKAGSVASAKRWASWMVEREILSSNPFAGVTSPGIESRDNVPTPQEVEQILKCAHGPTHHILSVLVGTGARPKELRDARVGWFQVDKFVVPIQFAKKGRPRTILLNERCSQLVASLCEDRESDEHVFLNHKNKPWTQNGLLQALRRCCSGRKFAPYDMRHAFATNALECGVDSLLVGHLMGHADVTMVAKVYAKPRESRLKEIMVFLDQH